MTVGSMGGRCYIAPPRGLSWSFGAGEERTRALDDGRCCVELAPDIGSKVVLRPSLVLRSHFNGHDVRSMRGVDGAHASDLLRRA